MTQLMQALLDRLRFLHAETRAVLEAVPGEALDWVPGAGMNSICATVVHLLGAERYYVGDVACGDPLARDRDAEFRASGVGAESLMAQLAQADQYAEQALGRLDPGLLETMRLSPAHGREFSGAWAIAHAIEHGALHVGHIQVIRQLWEQSRDAGNGPVL